MIKFFLFFYHVSKGLSSKMKRRAPGLRGKIGSIRGVGERWRLLIAEPSDNGRKPIIIPELSISDRFVRLASMYLLWRCCSVPSRRLFLFWSVQHVIVHHTMCFRTGQKYQRAKHRGMFFAWKGCALKPSSEIQALDSGKLKTFASTLPAYVIMLSRIEF